MTRRELAYHEAGHAVVATVFGFDVRRVMVHQAVTRANGEGGRCETSSWRQDLNADPVRALYYTLAGGAAERRLTGRPPRGDGGDRECAADLAVIVCEVGDEQHPRAVALLKSAEAVALGMMHDETVWKSIERVAAALQRKGVLTGRDVALAIREARQR